MWSSASASWWGRGGPSAHAHALVGFFPVSQRTLLGVLGGVFWGAQLWLLSHAHLAAAGRAIQGYTVLEYSSTHFGFQTVIFLYVQKAVQLCVWYQFLRIRKDDGLKTASTSCRLACGREIGVATVCAVQHLLGGMCLF